MATPVFACGFECGALGHLAGVNAPTFDATTFRSGLRAGRCNPSAQQTYLEWAFGVAGIRTMAMRIYFRFASLPTGDTIIAGGRLASTSTMFGLGFQASDGKLYSAHDDGITFGFGSTGLTPSTNTWYRADIKVDTSANPATTTVSVDGTDLGAKTKAVAAADLTHARIGAGTRAATMDVYFDDWLVSHTIGDYPLGAGYVLSYIPNADGTHNVAGANDFERSLTGTDITNATTDAYDLINDRPLPTTAVDFINGVAPPNSTDYVEWQYEDSVEANAPNSVEAIIVHHDAGGAGTNNWTVTLRESGGGTSADIWTGTTNVGGTITTKRAHFATVPGTATAWDTTKFNALRSRFLVSDASPDVYIDAAMLEADFPSPAATFSPPFRSKSIHNALVR